MCFAVKANLLTAVHLIDSGLIDDWLRGSSSGSTKDLRLSRYFVKLSRRQPLMMTDSLLPVKDASIS